MSISRKTLGLIFIFVVLGFAITFMFLSSSEKASDSGAFTPEEADAASDLAVAVPPVPTPPEWAETSAKKEAVSTANSANLPTEDTSRRCAEGAASSDFFCYQDLYQVLVKEKSIEAAFADLKARYDKNDYVRSQCHPLTHVIGRAAAARYEEVSEAYLAGDGYCWSGYYHGVLEAFVARIGLANIPTKIDGVCKKLNADGRYSFDYFNCVHGLGHGLMAITDTELYQSLKYCDSLTGDWEQQSCAGGVFMENVIVDGLNHVTKYLDPKRPQFPCDESPDKYKNTCYLMQTSYMLKINGGNFSKTFEWCRDAEQFKDTCFQSLGRDASGRSVSDGPTTKKTCELGGDENEVTQCMIGAVKDFVSYFHSNKQALAFCDLFEDSDIRTTCGQTVISYYTSF